MRWPVLEVQRCTLQDYPYYLEGKVHYTFWWLWEFGFLKLGWVSERLTPSCVLCPLFSFNWLCRACNRRGMHSGRHQETLESKGENRSPWEDSILIIHMTNRWTGQLWTSASPPYVIFPGFHPSFRGSNEAWCLQDPLHLCGWLVARFAWPLGSIFLFFDDHLALNRTLSPQQMTLRERLLSSYMALTIKGPARFPVYPTYDQGLLLHAAHALEIATSSCLQSEVTTLHGPTLILVPLYWDLWP